MADKEDVKKFISKINPFVEKMANALFYLDKYKQAITYYDKIQYYND